MLLPPRYLTSDAGVRLTHTASSPGAAFLPLAGVGFPGGPGAGELPAPCLEQQLLPGLPPGEDRGMRARPAGNKVAKAKRKGNID